MELQEGSGSVLAAALPVHRLVSLPSAARRRLEAAAPAVPGRAAGALGTGMSLLLATRAVLGGRERTWRRANHSALSPAPCISC